MEMHQIRYFLAVAEELNFTRAAEKCHVAQPSLTRAVKLLEAELGGPLFHRERANTHLTDLGHLVRPHLRQIHDESAAARRLAADFGTLAKAPLKLGVMCTIAPHQLADLLMAIQVRHPGIEVELTDAPARDLHRRLTDGSLEAAIYCLPGDADERLHALPLFREQMMIVVSAASPLAARHAIRPADLAGAPYLNRVNCEFNGYPGISFMEHGAVCIHRGERDDWILAMIAAGAGFGFMPEHAVIHPGVVARPLIEPEYWRDIHLVTVRGRPHSPAVGALVREAMRIDRHGGARRATAASAGRASAARAVA